MELGLGTARQLSSCIPRALHCLGNAVEFAPCTQHGSVLWTLQSGTLPILGPDKTKNYLCSCVGGFFPIIKFTHVPRTQTPNIFLLV